MDSIPRFDGTEAKRFARKFESAMLILKEDEDKRMALFFGTAVEPDTVADRWYEELEDKVKESYIEVKKAMLKRFCKTGVDAEKGMAALNKLNDMKLSDEDVGTRMSTGVTRTQRFVDEVEKLLPRIPKETTDLSKLVALQSGMGPHLKRMIANKQLHQFEDVMDWLRDMSETDINDIRRNVVIDSRAGWRLTNPFNQYSGSNTSNYQQSTSYQQNAPYQQSGNYRPQPLQSQSFQSNRQQGYSSPAKGGANVTSEHQAKIDEWCKRNPNIEDPPAESGYPCVPGTEAPGTNECYKCGYKGHRSRECTGVVLPILEQRYRYNVSTKKIAEKGFGSYQRNDYQRMDYRGQASGSNNTPVPIRAIGGYFGENYIGDECSDMIVEEGRDWLNEGNDYGLGQ
ncbi:hypothetical protein FFLO_04710 [Filobasidium floriforme]|uniref:CCHC-type domain-containing protein n=1 Tax=Filobasidium floriforme TaxID=5210 RepID=A0A8K0NM44_9TREE|nr:hypothetical protein FFLO_04710 [Filobasidium floriforme]